MLRFSDKNEVYEIPRLEDELIDELFYQEDEIGEMRYSAFMVECGLEEDPPDGPDVEPIPWPKNPSGSSMSSKKALKAEPESPKKFKRSPPTRSQSLDVLDIFEEQLASPTRSPRSRLTAAKSGTLHGMRRPSLPSADDLDNSGVSLSLAQTEKESPGARRKLVVSKSGSLHQMRRPSLLEGTEEQSRPARRGSKLVVSKSGTLHNMRRTRKDESTKRQESIKSIASSVSSIETSDDDDSLFSGIDMATDSDDDISISTDDSSGPKRRIARRSSSKSSVGLEVTEPKEAKKTKKSKKEKKSTKSKDKKKRRESKSGKKSDKSEKKKSKSDKKTKSKSDKTNNLRDVSPKPPQRGGTS